MYIDRFQQPNHRTPTFRRVETSRKVVHIVVVDRNVSRVVKNLYSFYETRKVDARYFRCKSSMQCVCLCVCVCASRDTERPQRTRSPAKRSVHRAPGSALWCEPVYVMHTSEGVCVRAAGVSVYMCVSVSFTFLEVS